MAKDRVLHPHLKDAIEFFLFTKGRPPLSFIQKDLSTMVVDTARAMEQIQVREEGGNNLGEIVGWIQSIIGEKTETGDGYSWCMSLNQCIIAFIEDFVGVKSPVLASENCMDVFRAAEKIPGLLLKDAFPGSFFILGYTETTGHTGTVLRLFPNNVMETFEGNTGNSSVNDGDGAFVKMRSGSGTIGRGTLQGFVLMYPNNLIPKAV